MLEFLPARAGAGQTAHAEIDNDLLDEKCKIKFMLWSVFVCGVAVKLQPLE